MGVENILLTSDSIDVQGTTESVAAAGVGAIASFVGTVRPEKHATTGEPLLALEYEAYEPMALAQMQAIREKAIADFGILDAAIVHRLGRIFTGGASIVVAVGSAHRAAAFDACRWIVDQIKCDVPIWKKDVWSDGTTQWVDPSA